MRKTIVFLLFLAGAIPASAHEKYFDRMHNCTAHGVVEHCDAGQDNAGEPDSAEPAPSTAPAPAPSPTPSPESDVNPV